MSKHDAQGQMAGYLYQVLSALLLIMDNNNDVKNLTIEKFDDVSFLDDKDNPSTLLQIKHQIKAKGNLSDTSTDLWRSINSWCDSIINKNLDVSATKFVIITTAAAPINSIAYYLQENLKLRDTKKARELMLVAASGSQKTTELFRKNFLELDKDKQTELVSNIYIYDNSVNIKDFREELKKDIRWGTLPKFEDLICEQLEGWWFQKAIQFLCSNNIIFIDRKQVQTKVYEIASSYREDSLPITVDPFAFLTENEMELMNNDVQLFIEQLKLISMSDVQIKRAVRDYYRAYQQRSKWIREDLLYINELENYEERLVDEWQRLFEISKGELEDNSLNDEKSKIKVGKKLYNEAEKLEVYIKERVTQPFIIRGSLHNLSNRLRIGGHVDFYERLYKLLKEVPV